MGVVLAKEIASSDKLSLDDKLSWHLQVNFSPSIPEVLIPVCRTAIALADNGLDLSQKLALPEGVQFHSEDRVSAQQILDDHHLWYFTQQGEPSAN
jgi:hypothetical protein